MYLEEGVYRDQGQNGMDSFKALEWWNVHKLKYRVLSKMAMDVLAIPISTVASEATFSVGGRTSLWNQEKIEGSFYRRRKCPLRFHYLQGQVILKDFAGLNLL
ncbi:unnamed protein product [Lactuca virosa]|uniref:HAT C-terminal dimerisation domain-containing protein n=1 Tax=Lactuca virosa TaxID=75947 RepID=A0AAU9LML4_9ASTR|nr:unnamed protein product [Lactuca virosa]